MNGTVKIEISPGLYNHSDIDAGIGDDLNGLVDIDGASDYSDMGRIGGMIGLRRINHMREQ